MISKSLNIIKIIFTITMLALMAGCSGNSGNGSSSTGSGGIVAKLQFGDGANSTKKVVALAPANVATISVTISGSNITTIQQSFAASAGTGTIAGVPAGSGLTVTFKGLDSYGNVLYLGSVSNVTVQVGQNTDLGSIALQELIYSVSGTVTSGGVGLAGVTLTLAGPKTYTTTSNSNGNYTFTSTQNGSYTMSAFTTGYTMTQSSQSLTVNGTNVSGINFTTTHSPVSGDIVTITYAQLSDGSYVSAISLAIDKAGDFYIGDPFSRIYRMTPSTGAIYAVAGGGNVLGDNGPATSANLQYPGPVAIDNAGNIYIPDTGNNRIRKVSVTSGIITTIAGNVTAGFSGDNGPATSAILYKPTNIALDSTGNIYFSDSGNNRVRKIDATTGIITTVAGGGSDYNYNVPATTALLNDPEGLAFDNDGNLYIAAKVSNRIFKVIISTGIITSIAGTFDGYAGDNGPATSAKLYYPLSIAFDSVGNLFVTDTANHCVRKINLATGIITTVAGNGAYGYAGDNGPATSANLNSGYIIFDSADNFYITDHSVIRKVFH